MPRPTPPIALSGRTWLWAIASFVMLPVFVATAAEKLSFNRDVRPILAENCFACHGPDSASRKADLRLDRREVAVKAGAIVPGKPDESELIHRIFATDNDEVMPPPSIHKQLTAAQKETLKAWIAAGAEYQPLWSFIPPVRPALPAVKNAGLGPQPDRSFRPGRFGAARIAAGPRGRPPHPGPAAESRSDRPAAGAGDGRGVCQRQVAGCLREAGRAVDAVAALGRTSGPLLARRRPLCRHQRHPLRQLPRDLVLSRLGHRRLQSEHAVRPLHDRAVGRRPAAQRHATNSGSPRASTAATSPPTKAARSAKSTWCSIPAIGPRPRRGYGWA